MWGKYMNKQQAYLLYSTRVLLVLKIKKEGGGGTQPKDNHNKNFFNLSD